MLINSTNFYNQGGSDNSAGTPCSTGFVDVKATETDAPWFLKVANLVGLGNPTINAHARVSLTPNDRQRLPTDRAPGQRPQTRPGHVRERGHQRGAGDRAAHPDGAANGNAVWDNVTPPITLPVASASRTSA